MPAQVNRRADPLSLVLVGAQLALLAAIAFAPRGPVVLDGVAVDALAVAAVVAGVALVLWAAVALGRGLTPMPEPRPGGALVTHGPYRLTRHPMYVGVLLGAAGVAAFRGGVVPLALVGGLAVVLVVKARHEERLLRRTYPGYERYAARRGN